jgi:hypothetical protein
MEVLRRKMVSEVWILRREFEPSEALDFVSLSRKTQMICKFFLELSNPLVYI